MQRKKKFHLQKSRNHTFNDTLNTNFKDNYPDEKHC